MLGDHFIQSCHSVTIKRLQFQVLVAKWLHFLTHLGDDRTTEQGHDDPAVLLWKLHAQGRVHTKLVYVVCR